MITHPPTSTDRLASSPNDSSSREAQKVTAEQMIAAITMVRTGVPRVGCSFTRAGGR